MSVVWLTIGGLAVGTFLIKAAGPVVLGGRTLPNRVTAVIALIAPAVLSALVVVETLDTGTRGVQFDARLAGLAAAGGALALRLPLLAVVAVAAGVTALCRLVL